MYFNKLLAKLKFANLKIAKALKPCFSKAR